MPIAIPGLDADRLTIMSVAECWRRLAAGTVGRVVFTERALPAIRPVNYTVAGSRILLRCSPVLAARLDAQIVAFEIDEIDPALESGLSVVVTGTARVPRESSELTRVAAIPLAAWAGAGHGTPVWITPGDVQGRRVQRSPNPDRAELDEPGVEMLTLNPTLAETAQRLLAEARADDSGRAAETLVGGRGHVLRQTVIALQRGQQLCEHANPGEATLLVLAGAVELHAAEAIRAASAGELLTIPPCPHSVLAAEDAAVLLTVAMTS